MGRDLWLKKISMRTRVTIIGFGTMGRAIARTLHKKNRAVRVLGIDKNNVSMKVAGANISQSDFVILAVKPQDAAEAIGRFKKYFGKKTILVSIMAGVSLRKLNYFSGHRKIIRMMPNLGLSVGEGIAVWKGMGLSKPETARAKKFISKITDNFEVKDEDTINKVTAVSGSGPAYFFLLANYLARACGRMGLTKNESRKLVEKTFSASATLGKAGDYSALVKKVASKGGTTEAALEVFRKRNFDKIVSEAVRAAYQRAKELSK